MDCKYKGKFVEMQGIIEEIHDGDIKILPLDSDFLQMSGAVCHFEKADPVMIERLETVVKGDVGIIRGTIKDIDDFMFTEIEMDPCLLVLTPTIPTLNDAELEEDPDAISIFLEGSGLHANTRCVGSD